MQDIEPFRREARAMVGEAQFIDDPRALARLTDNTLGLERTLAAAAYPESTEQVAGLVRLARDLKVPLYPVSRGRNMGYGDRAPAMDGHVLLDLSRMRAVREYDQDLGWVVIESGVSQQELYDFLRQRNSPYWMDATGAGLEASIVGNTLEGGFGHTPLGNHREAFSDLEVVLGNGLIFHTGRFPSLGPDLKGLFVQSNFGVITAMRLPLMPAPEHFESFVLRCDEASGLPGIVEAMRRLRMEGVLTSCVHIANAVRYLVSSRRCPPEYQGRTIDDQEARRIMSSRLLPVGYWNAAGGLYGLRRAVAAHKARMAGMFKGLAHVQFFSDAKLNMLGRLAGLAGGLGLPAVKRVKDSLESFTHIHHMMKGVPTDEAFRNILWRVDSLDRMGLIWFAPVAEAKGQEAGRILELAAPLFAKRGFDMPVTITLVSAERMVAVLNISFDKTDPQEKSRAWALYDELREKFAANAIGMYRSSIMNMSGLTLQDPARQEVLNRIKSVLDPDQIISRGRYGIGWPRENQG